MARTKKAVAETKQETTNVEEKKASVKRKKKIILPWFLHQGNT